eukprot:comp21221_c0_seq1/m.28866 comp21221_c0_seq1/g.28866  ORF comp21221_c0_seq1/g.28866 comp21221_c0_seq1/m.28866 type:complete len:480 (-) comp21221_c0_seq1:755-2194(-)
MTPRRPPVYRRPSKEFVWSKDDLSVECWVYRDEGGANIILGYTGDNPELKGQVLRLRKRFIAPTAHHPKPAYMETDIHDFVKRVVFPLFDGRFLAPGILVTTPATFLEALNAQIAPHRPPHRVAMEIDVDISVGLLLPDLTSSPSYWLPVDEDLPKVCVEIKPKWGYLPQSPFIDPQHAPTKATTCRFCMHQHLKLEKGQQKEVSRYCPLDLYSGDRIRMLKALGDLLWTPQNNLKVYRNNTSVLMHTKDPNVDPASRIADLSTALQDVLPATNPSEMPITTVHAEDPLLGTPSAAGVLCEVLADILLADNPMPHIRAVQQLDQLDVECIHTLYERLLQIDSAYPIDGQWFRDEWVNAAPDTVKQILEGKSAPPPTDLSSVSEEEMCRLVRQFLIATAAKDCSIMITLQQLPASKTEDLSSGRHRHTVYNKASGHYYQFSVNIIDTDPKYFVNIPKYLKDDRKIVEAFIASGSTRKCTA